MSTPAPRLLALAASTRDASLNRRLLGLAVRHAEAAGATVTVLDYAECSSVFYDGTTSQLPAGAARLRDALLAHDGLLLASPEYNWSMPGSLKNLIDWLSVDPAAPLKGRTGLLMCATPSIRGGVVGLSQLAVPLEVLGMWLYPQRIGIGDATNQLREGGLARAKDDVHLRGSIDDFVAVTRRLCHR